MGQPHSKIPRQPERGHAENKKPVSRRLLTSWHYVDLKAVQFLERVV